MLSHRWGGADVGTTSGQMWRGGTRDQRGKELEQVTRGNARVSELSPTLRPLVQGWVHHRNLQCQIVSLPLCGSLIYILTSGCLCFVLCFFFFLKLKYAS